MEIFRLLEKSNCRECDEATCLAFAAAVFKGQKQIDECPHVSHDVIERLRGKTERRILVENNPDAAVEMLRKQIPAIDLSMSAQRLGGTFIDNKLTIRVLGKDFGIDSQGNLSSDVHIHPWVTIPILSYVMGSAGMPVSGKWIPFRELKGGATWHRLFEQRCEKPLKKVADTYPDLFEDMIRLFNGRQEDHYASDISLVLHPLPKVPILVCYWQPEEGLESNLNVFFDSTAEENLRIESIYLLGTGLVRMFEKIALRHGAR